MLTRSQEKNAETTINTVSVNGTPSKTKAKRQPTNNTEILNTPGKVAKSDDLVSNILNTIQKSNADQSIDLKGEQKKKPASEKSLLPKKVPQIHIRGKPKSGRPWKDVKQK